MNRAVTCYVAALLASVLTSASAYAQTSIPARPPAPTGPTSAPNKMPPQLLPDLKVDYVTGASTKVYAAKIVNIGAIPSAASNVYCAATVSNAVQWYTIEIVQPIPGLAVNASHTVNCDFGSGAKSIKPGEKLQSVNFVVNNGKLIRESNYENNSLRTNVN